MDEKQLLMFILTKTYGLTEVELGSRIYDGEALKADAGDLLINMDVARVQKIKDNIDTTTIFTEAFNKATKKVKDAFEKQLKETTGFESDLQGVDLVIAWGQSLKSAAEITDEKVKIHPLYLNLENELKEKYSGDLLQSQNDFKDFKDGIERKSLISDILLKVEEYFIDSKPVLSEDDVRANTQKKTFIAQFENPNWGYEPVGDKHIVLQDGKRLEDAHGNPVFLDNFVKSLTAKHFDIKVQDDIPGAGNRNKQQKQLNIPKTKEEYNKAISEATTDEERVQIGAAYAQVRDN